MSRDSKILFSQLTAQIEQAKQEEFDRLLAKIAADDKKGMIRSNNREYENRMLCLRCARVAVVLGGFVIKTPKLNAALKEDCRDIIDRIAAFEIRRKTDKGVVSDAIDCVMAMSGGGIFADDVARAFSKEFPNDGIIYAEAEKQLPYLFLEMSTYLMRNGNTDLAVQVLLYLLERSRERLPEGSDAYNRNAAAVVAGLGDANPQLTHEICQREQPNFDNKTEHDLDDSDFYYFQGCAAIALNKMDEAYAAYGKSYEIRKADLGEDELCVQLARRERAIAALGLQKDTEESIDALSSFLEKLQDGSFDDEMDEQNKLMLEAKTVYLLVSVMDMDNQCLISKPYLDRYGELCGLYEGESEYPFLSRRRYLNALGCYYLRTEDYFKAEKCFRDALSEPQGTGSEGITDALIKVNLLMVYIRQNDAEQMLTLLEKLEDMAAAGSAEITEKIRYRIMYAHCAALQLGYIEFDEEAAVWARGVIAELSAALDGGQTKNRLSAVEAAMSLFIAASLLLQQEGTERTEKAECLRLMKHLAESHLRTPEPSRAASMYAVLAGAAYGMDDSAAIEYIEKAEKLASETQMLMAAYADICATKANILFGEGRGAEAAESAEKALQSIETQRCAYVKYCNDESLMNMLVNAQRTFYAAYGVLRETVPDDWAIYEIVIRGKSLASLAGKERNRVIRSGRMDSELAQQIRAAQDRLAAFEAQNVFIESDAPRAAERERLFELEARFAEEFPDDVRFTQITADAVKNRIPRNSVVVEYCLCANTRDAKNPQEKDLPAVIDVFIIQKKDGECSIRTLTVPNAEDIISEAANFNFILQKEALGEADSDDMTEKRRLRKSLYRGLIEPIEPFIDGFETVWLAPDNSVINLPFDVIGKSESDIPGDRYNFVVIECSRDFLFGTDETDGTDGGSLVIGDPKYLINEKLRQSDAEPVRGDDEPSRGAQMTAEDLCRLPFSRIEARRVNEYCGGSCFTGASASRGHLLNCGKMRNIHIATHGSFDLAWETNSLYSSCLFFAGATDWMKTGKPSAEYGNGVVTADEISRTDCRNVELVVLSSCLSGMNDAYINKGFRGMVGGFSAAGVKYVISCLWSADDFATAVLMTEFYRQYKQCRLSPPAALREAKRYMRRVTIAELARDGWFDEALKSSELSAELREAVCELSLKAPQFSPYKNEIYWAGFTCFRCN